MNINRNNYEVFFIDYFDGKLSAGQVAALMLFLSQNTDLKEEFSSFEEVSLIASDIKFLDKESLKKISQKDFFVTDENFENICISYIEKDLNNSEKKIFEKYLQQHPEKYHEYELFSKTILKPEIDIYFENKSGLKRYELNNKSRRIFIASLSAAASVLIIFLLYFFNSDKSEVIPRYAERNNVIPKNTIDTTESDFQYKFSTQKEQVQQNKLKEKIKIQNQILKQNKIQDKNNSVTDNTVNLYKDSILKQNKSRINSEPKVEAIEHIELKKLVAIEIETPIHENIYIEWSKYKIQKVRKEESQTLAQVIKSKFQKAVFGKNTEPKHRFGIIDVADIVVRGISKMTGKNMKIHKTYDSKGEVETLAFYSENLQVYKGGKK